ncbi:MAG: glycosyltransferase [Bacteroidales bacterium]|nr:glycosyltransferase [Bacteroidales bacterium]
MSKGLSVVICSYNSEKRIKKVLDCLANQENCENILWEVIMVDNASTDNVVEVARQSWRHPTVPLHIFHEYKQGQSYATRTGFEKATYDVVVTVDDDNYVCPTYISRAFKIMEEHPEVGIAGGRGIGYFDEEPPAWFKDVEQGFAIGPQAEKEGYVSNERGYLYGAGAVIRKPVYDYLMNSDFELILKGRIGKSLVAGEDAERCQAFCILGYKLWYDPKLEFQHHMASKRIDWNYTRKLYNSFGRASNYHELYDDILNKPKGLRFLIRNVLFLNILKMTYSYLISLPFFIKIKISFPKEGSLEILKYDFMNGKYNEYYLNLSKIRRFRIKLKKAKWINSNVQNKSI